MHCVFVRIFFGTCSFLLNLGFFFCWCLCYKPMDFINETISKLAFDQWKKHGLKKPSWFSKGTYPPKKPPGGFFTGILVVFPLVNKHPRTVPFTRRCMMVNIHGIRRFLGISRDEKPVLGRWQRPSIGSSEKYVCVRVFFFTDIFFVQGRAGHFFKSTFNSSFMVLKDRFLWNRLLRHWNCWETKVCI